MSMYARLVVDHIQVSDVAHNLRLAAVYAQGLDRKIVESPEVDMSHRLVRPRADVVGEASERVLADDYLVDYTL